MARKKRRSGNKQTARAIGSVSLEVIQKRRTERPEQRKASREAALRYVGVYGGNGVGVCTSGCVIT